MAPSREQIADEMTALKKAGYSDDQIVEEMNNRYAKKSVLADLAPAYGAVKLTDKAFNYTPTVAPILPATSNAETLSQLDAAEAAGQPQGMSMAGKGLAGLAALKGAYDTTRGFERGGTGMRTGMTELGAGIGSFIPGIGAIAGAGIGNLAGYAAKRLGLFKKTTDQIQQGRYEDVGRSDLYNADVEGPNYKGKVGESGPDFVGINAQGQWENNPFANTRDVKYLTPYDLMSTPDVYNLTPDWDKLDQAVKDTVLQELLTRGAVSERKGGIYFDDKLAKQVLADVQSGKITKSLYKPVSLASVAPGGTNRQAGGNISINVNYPASAPAPDTSKQEKAAMALSLLSSNPYSGTYKMPDYSKLLYPERNS